MYKIQVRFSVLDNSDPQNPDFFFVPLIFLESFSAPAMVLNIAGQEITMPVDWSIAVGCSDSGMDIEILPLTSINERGFEAFCMNPIKGYRADFQPVEIVNIYQDVRWFFPKMKNGQLLSVPLHDGHNPPCVYFVKEISRQSEQVELANLL